MAVTDWSTSADANQTADTAINWREGQPPSSVNNSARAMMAAIAAMIDDQGGASACTATSTNAWVFTPGQPVVTATQYLIGFIAPASNTGAVVMRFGSGGTDYAVRRKGNADLVSGQITAGSFYLATFQPGTPGQFLLVNDTTDFADTVPKTGGTFIGGVRLQSNPSTSTAGILLFGAGSTYLYFDGSNFILDNQDSQFGLSLTYGGTTHYVWHQGNFNPASYAALGADASFGTLNGTTVNSSGQGSFAGDLTLGGNIRFNAAELKIFFTSTRTLYRNNGNDCYQFLGGAGVILPDGGLAWSRAMHNQPIEQIRHVAGGYIDITYNTPISVPGGSYMSGVQTNAATISRLFYDYLQAYRSDIGWYTMTT